MLAPWKESYEKLRQHIKKQRHHFADEGLYNQNYSFSISYGQMWELDHKEDWALKYWWFWIVWYWRRESLLDCEEIKPVNPQGNQPWIFIGNTDAETEALILWPPAAKWWLPGKRPWCLERLKAKWEVGGRGWKGWVTPPTHWTWIWANPGR